jgi:hypothetical protein
VFISEERWNKEKLDYINNLKKGIKYELKEEVDLDNDVIVDNVFDINKVEII